MANLFLLQALAQTHTGHVHEKVPAQGRKCLFTQMSPSRYVC